MAAVGSKTMKPLVMVGSMAVLIFVSACSDHKAEERRAKEDAEAKARAAAARKEMDALPKAFETPDYFKKNEPQKKPEATASDPKKANP